MDTEDLSRISTHMLDDNCVNVEAMAVAHITPESNTESEALLFDFASPLSSPQKSASFPSPPKDNMDPCTGGSSCSPMEGVFDSFAHGPVKLTMAPLRSKATVSRKLDFDCELSVNLFPDWSRETELLMEDLNKVKSTPSAKKVTLERKLRTLKSMR